MRGLLPHTRRSRPMTHLTNQPNRNRRTTVTYWENPARKDDKDNDKLTVGRPTR